MEKTELLITHHGRTLHGYFFKPKATRKFPLVIMSHGYNGYKDDFEKTAEYLAILEPAWKDSIEMDVNLKLRIRQQGLLRDPEYFSTGWQDLFRLAQRFALMDALCEGESSVAVLDDPFVNLDEEKRARTLELLNQIGKQRQIIYFTCRR